MFKSLKVVRLAAGAAAALLGGFAGAGLGHLRRGSVPSLRPGARRGHAVERGQPGSPGRDRLPDRV